MLSIKINNKIIEEYINTNYKNNEEQLITDLLTFIKNKQQSKKDDYELAFLVSKKLGLSRTYFSDALRKSVSLNKADVLKIDGHIYVKLDKEIVSLLEDHICMKISRDDIEDFDKHIFLTKNTILGFYK